MLQTQIVVNQKSFEHGPNCDDANCNSSNSLTHEQQSSDFDGGLKVNQNGATSTNLLKVDAVRLHEITVDNFKEKVVDSHDPWIVEFYSGMCGGCQQFAPVFDEFAKNVKRKVHVHIGKVNIDEQQGLKLALKLNALEFGVPTIRIFANHDNVGTTIQGGMDTDLPDGVTASSLEQQALNQLQGLKVALS